MVSTMDEEETDLTSLAWLNNLNIMATLPTPPSSPPSKPHYSIPHFRKKPPPLRLTLSPGMADEYKNSDKKPPFSYATLICMAMKANQNKMTLSAIYSWIKDNFKYFKQADPSWQNSIRHNLSLNKCFVKVAREKNEPGKGGFWKLDLNRLHESGYCRTKSIGSRVRRRLKRDNVMQEITKSVGTDPLPMGTEVPLVALPEVQSVPQSRPLTEEEEQAAAVAAVLEATAAAEVVQRDVMLGGGPAVIVESIVEEEDDMNAMVWGPSPAGWDDSQLELLHSLLDSL